VGAKPHYPLAGIFRNRRKVFVVQLVVLADKSRKAYIPSPLKRWYGIGAQPRLSKRLNLV